LAGNLNVKKGPKESAKASSSLKEKGQKKIQNQEKMEGKNQLKLGRRRS